MRTSLLSLRLPALALSLPLLFLAGCSKAPETKEAVQASIVQHLTQREDGMGKNMDVQVVAVTFRGDEADADVQITPKGTTAGIRMPYSLKREGDKWVVQKKAPSATVPSATDPGAAAPGAAPSGTISPGALPPGHVPVDGAAPSTGQLPAGHPPVGQAPAGAAPNGPIAVPPPVHQSK